MISNDRSDSVKAKKLKEKNIIMPPTLLWSEMTSLMKGLVEKREPPKKELEENLKKLCLRP